MREIDFENLVTTDERLAAATDLLKRFVDKVEEGPSGDPEWWHDYFLFTGEHMVLTDEGWTPGSEKQGIIDQCGADAIEDEVNAPA